MKRELPVLLTYLRREGLRTPTPDCSSIDPFQLAALLIYISHYYIITRYCLLTAGRILSGSPLLVLIYVTRIRGYMH